MEFTSIYEYQLDKSSDLLIIIPLLILLTICSTLVYYIKLKQKAFNIVRQIAIFGGVIGIVISSVFIIILLINAPGIVYSERRLKDIVNNQDYLVIEGEVEKFEITESNGQFFESFMIGTEKFKYSDYKSVAGFHQTSKSGGPITSDGLYLRIYYINIDGDNYIFKIEQNAQKSYPIR